MTDSYAPYTKEEIQTKKQGRYQASVNVFTDAYDLAKKHGMSLLCLNESHYQLRKSIRWLTNLYPGNQRIYSDRNQPKIMPYLHLSLERDWNILDIVKAVISQEAEGE